MSSIAFHPETHLHQEDLGVVLDELLQALEVPCLTFRGERHLRKRERRVGGGSSCRFHPSRSQGMRCCTDRTTAGRINTGTRCAGPDRGRSVKRVVSEWGYILLSIINSSRKRRPRTHGMKQQRPTGVAWSNLYPMEQFFKLPSLTRIQSKKMRGVQARDCSSMQLRLNRRNKEGEANMGGVLYYVIFGRYDLMIRQRRQGREKLPLEVILGWKSASLTGAAVYAHRGSSDMRKVDSYPACVLCFVVFWNLGDDVCVVQTVGKPGHVGNGAVHTPRLLNHEPRLPQPTGRVLHAR